MPDATKYLDATPDVTPGNQDVPGAMNQPPPYRGQSPPWTGSFTPQEVQSTEPPASVDDDDLEAHTTVRPGDMPEDQTYPSQFPGDSPVPLDVAELAEGPKGAKQFDTDNPDAVATFERASHDWNSGQFPLSSTAMGGGAVQIVGRQKGRKSTTLWVPATDMNGNAIKGCVFGQTEGELQGTSTSLPAFLLPGDSVTIASEAAVYVNVIPGQTAGLVCWETEYNPAGGELGGM